MTSTAPAPGRVSLARSASSTPRFGSSMPRGIRAVASTCHCRVRCGQGHPVQAFPVPRTTWSSPTWTRSTSSGPASCTPPQPQPAPPRRTSSSASSTRCAPPADATATTAARSSTPPPSHSRAPRCTPAPWNTSIGARLGTRPGRPRRRPDPDLLARALTLLLDGGLAAGALDASPEAPEAAKASARALVSAATARSGA